MKRWKEFGEMHKPNRVLSNSKTPLWKAVYFSFFVLRSHEKINFSKLTSYIFLRTVIFFVSLLFLWPIICLKRLFYSVFCSQGRAGLIYLYFLLTIGLSYSDKKLDRIPCFNLRFSCCSTINCSVDFNKLDLHHISDSWRLFSVHTVSPPVWHLVAIHLQCC